MCRYIHVNLNITELIVIEHPNQMTKAFSNQGSISPREEFKALWALKIDITEGIEKRTCHFFESLYKKGRTKKKYFLSLKTTQY